MFGVAAMREVREAVGRYAGGFDPALVSATDAQAIVEEAVAAEHMLATVKALAARRVAETDLWRRRGERSPAHHLARTAGTSVGKAQEALDTARRLDGLPALASAARQGRVSPEQAAPIAEAAAVAPGAERRLLEAARSSSLVELRDSCARTKAAALPDDAARHDAIHRSRHLRRRRLADGAGELTYRSTLAEVAEVYAIAQGFADRRFAAARQAGTRQAPEAYLADGLLDAVRAGATTTTERGTREAAEPATGAGEEGVPAAGGTGGGVPASAGAPARSVTRVAPRPHKVIVRIDWDALVRGHPVPGEVCEIAGLGPVPVSAVRDLVATGDAFLAAVVTKGVDVATVAHLGRRPTAFQQTALQWRDPVCAVQGCSAAVRLEYDHVQTWAETRFTLASLLERACPHHHDLKSHQGWDFVAGAGKRPLVPPHDPRHPRHAKGPPAAGG